MTDPSPPPTDAKRSDLPPWARPLQPPACPPGWRIGPPDFVGVGVQRAGTSWWTRVVEAHPRIERPAGRSKELHYFDRFWQGAPPEDFVARYHAMFPRAEGTLTGEWTPRYMYDFWTPPLLARAAPDARLIVLLRDPVERYLSGLSRQARGAQKRGQPLRPQEWSDAIFRGLYHQQMRRLLEFFAREQVLVLQYERCRTDPHGQMEATFRFLGLEAPEEMAELEVLSRPGRWKPELSDSARAELVARMADDVLGLAELCPEVDLALWPNFAHLSAPAGAGAGGAA